MSRENQTTSKLRKSATAPASPSAGDVYYNTTDNIAYCFNGTIWKALY